jgi:dienelactone hydrolase
MTERDRTRNTPALTAAPSVGLIDGPLHVAAQGLGAGASVTLRAHLLDARGVPWSSHATYVADASGSVDLATDAPVSGTYSGVDGDGLISSLAVAGNATARTFDSTSVAPLVVEFVAEISGRRVARAASRRLYVAEDVRTTLVRERDLSGLFFQPHADDERPGIVVLGGSSGGLLFASQVAALLAGHGYPSLALGYFGLEGRPRHLIDVPIEYFAGAIAWLSSRPGVRRDGIGVVGRSRGAELALLLGVRFPSIRSVVAYCPSSIVWNGLRGDAPVDASAWSEAGRPVPFCSLMTPDLSAIRSRVRLGSPVALTPLFDAALARPVPADAIVPVERTAGPILLVSGDDDQMWPSARMGDQIMERLAAHAHPFRSRHCRYPGAGHLMRPPGVSTHALHNAFSFGGERRAQAIANRAAWSETLAFLANSLGVAAGVNEPALTGGARCS